MSLLKKMSGVSTVVLMLAGMTAGSADAAEAIKAGIMLPLSGPSAAVGNQTREGVELGLKILDQSGGLLGKKIEYVVADDESVPAIGLSRVNELIAKNIEVLFGGWNSSVLLAYQPLMVKENIFSIATVAKVEQVLTGADKHAFKISPDNQADAEQIGKRCLEATASWSTGRRYLVAVTFTLSDRAAPLASDTSC